MEVEIIVPITLFLSVVLGIYVVGHHRFKTRQEMQLTVRAAIESGQTLSPEVMQQITDAINPPHSDLRRGILFLAVALGFVALALAMGEEDAFGPLMGIAAFPALVGVAYLVLSRLNPNRDE